MSGLIKCFVPSSSEAAANASKLVATCLRGIAFTFRDRCDGSWIPAPNVETMYFLLFLYLAVSELRAALTDEGLATISSKK